MYLEFLFMFSNLIRSCEDLLGHRLTLRWWLYCCKARVQHLQNWRTELSCGKSVSIREYEPIKICIENNNASEDNWHGSGSLPCFVPVLLRKNYLSFMIVKLLPFCLKHLQLTLFKFVIVLETATILTSS